MKTWTALILGAAPLLARAHEGHGLAGSHWHATDAWGFVAAGALVVLALWWRGRR